jgi:hypothetical protein
MLTAALLSGQLAAADREVLKTTWAGFQQQVTSRKLAGRRIQIRVSGRSIKTSLVDVTETHLVVRQTRGTAKWGSGNEQARIPREEIASVRFGGRTGNGRMIGLLVGLGAGAGIAAAVATGQDVSEGPLVVILPIAGVGLAALTTLAGYFIGRSFDQPGPEFVFS